MSTGLEPGSGWAGERGLSPGMLSQLQRFIQPLRDRVMGMVAHGWVRLVYGWVRTDVRSYDQRRVLGADRVGCHTVVVTARLRRLTRAGSRCG